MDVKQFVETHPVLVPVVSSAREKFMEYFGAETRLEIFTDPEDNQSTPKLFALALTPLSVKDASVLLDRLDEDWWLAQPYEVRRLMNIDVQYV
jgi:hypothetical protein